MGRDKYSTLADNFLVRAGKIFTAHVSGREGVRKRNRVGLKALDKFHKWSCFSLAYRSTCKAISEYLREDIA